MSKIARIEEAKAQAMQEQAVLLAELRETIARLEQKLDAVLANEKTRAGKAQKPAV